MLVFMFLLGVLSGILLTVGAMLLLIKLLEQHPPMIL